MILAGRQWGHMIKAPPSFGRPNTSTARQKNVSTRFGLPKFALRSRRGIIHCFGSYLKRPEERFARGNDKLMRYFRRAVLGEGAVSWLAVTLLFTRTARNDRQSQKYEDTGHQTYK